jgi:hypothetical protein
MLDELNKTVGTVTNKRRDRKRIKNKTGAAARLVPESLFILESFFSKILESSLEPKRWPRNDLPLGAGPFPFWR